MGDAAASAALGSIPRAFWGTSRKTPCHRPPRPPPPQPRRGLVASAPGFNVAPTRRSRGRLTGTPSGSLHPVCGAVPPSGNDTPFTPCPGRRRNVDISVPPMTDAPLPLGKLPSDLLGRLTAAYGSTDPSTLVGPGVGRDAAAIAIDAGVLVVKTDPITFATRSAAAYLVDVNANDVACLGASPRWLLATALLPEGTTPAAVETQFAELFAACRRRGISLIGGHTEVTAGLDRTILVGTLLGETTNDRLLRPGQSRPGDRLLLSKALAIEGTALLAQEMGDRLAPGIGQDTVERAQSLLTDPGISIVRDAEILLAAGGVTALHDPTEGGLAMGARELAAAAGAGIEIKRASVPLLPETTVIARQLGLDPLGMLASGSLLAAARPDAVPGLLHAARLAGIELADIGRVVGGGDGCTLRSEAGSIELPEFQTDEVSRALASA